MNKKDVYELTNPQKNIWNMEMFFNGSNINNICASGIIKEKVDFSLLKKALILFVEQNDCFQTRIFLDEHNSPMQYFSEFKPFDVSITDVSSLEDFHNLEQHLVKKTFNILNSCLFEFQLAKFSNGYGAVILNVHHIISDSWSLGITIQEIIKTYHSLKENNSYISNTISYKNYILAENEYKNSAKFIKDKDFWLNYLLPIPDAITLPSQTKSTINESSDGNRLIYTLDKNLMKKINNFCTNYKLSNYTFFMSIFSIFIGLSTNHLDFLIGTPILNRTNYKEKNSIGMFITTIPFRCNFKITDTFIDFSKKMGADLMSVLRHQKYSYTNIIEDLRKNSNDIFNLYNITLSYQITKAFSKDVGDYDTNWAFNNHCLNDINIHITDINDTGKLQLEYDFLTNKYSNKEIEFVHKCALRIIEQVLSCPNTQISDIKILPQQEENKILHEFNNRILEFNDETSVIQLFEKNVDLMPNNTALIYKNKRFTYEKLNKKVNRFARYLQSKNVSKGDIIGVCMNKTDWFIISILAIQKLGAAYLPIHPDYPEDRIKYILFDSKSKLLLTDSSIQNVNLDLYNDNNINISLDKTLLCYVIYTSGSTGKPKGVKLTHSNLLNFIYNFNDCFKTPFSSKDNCLSLTNISFDVSVCEIFTPLCFGATLVLYPKNTLTDIPLLGEIIEKENISFLYIPPNVLKDVYQFITFSNKQFPVNKLLVGVETIKNGTLNNYYLLNPNIEIINGYGPTETTICATFFRYIPNDKLNDIVPIGYPLKNNNIYILNKFNTLLPIGYPGEICISGKNVSLGYLENKELTEKSFVSIPELSNTPIYKTGDIGYWANEGYLNFIGRQDSQIKFKGHRIELTEINHVIKNIDGIQNSYTLIKEINEIPYLCSYVSLSNTLLTAESIKDSIQQQLPYYMIPSHIIILDKLPLTINGKIDKSALPDITIQGDEIVPPSTETEIILEKILCELIHAQNLSIDENFLELGIDSLLAIRFSIEITYKFNKKISIKDIFKYGTIRKLSKFLDKYEATSSIVIPKYENLDSYPLSSAQKRIYYACKMMGNNNLVYNTSGGILINKLLDYEKVKFAFSNLIKMQSSFRTIFCVQDEQIKQKILDDITLPIPIFEETNCDIQELVNNFPKPFYLEKAPLLRVELHYIDNCKTLILLDSHHIIMDGTSLHILLENFAKLYNSENIDDLKIEYKDFSIWENSYINSNLIKPIEEYWLKKFENSNFPSLDLPYDYPIPLKRSFVGTTLTQQLPDDFLKKYESYAKSLGMSPYMLFVSAFFVLLYTYTKQSEILLGTPIANRINLDTEKIIGMFVNTIVLRGLIDPAMKFSEFLDNIKSQILSDLDNQPYPFDLLVKSLGISTETSKNPLFDAMFIYQNTDTNSLTLGNSRAKFLNSSLRISKFNLSFEINPYTNTISIEYRTDLFKEKTIKSLSEHYLKILDNLFDNIDILIKDINVLSKHEKNRILFELNDTPMLYPHNKTISTLFEEQVQRTPNHPAITFQNKTLTYKELNLKANQLANHLRKLNIGRNDIIGIMLPRSFELLVCMLGTLKSGGCYIPIDPSFPKSRVQYMLNNSSAKFLLTTDTLFDTIDFENKICVDFENNEIYNTYTSNLPCINQPDDNSYIIYTSGSTGNPKGVVLKHKSLTNLCYFLNSHVEFFKNNSQSINIASITTASFDIFLFETLISLQKGLCVVLANEDEQRIPSLLNKLLINNNVKAIQMTPSRMQIFLDNIEDIPGLSNLDYVVLAGEPLPLSLKNNLLKLGIKKVYNGYGPSETTVFSTFTDVTDQNDYITIGRPLSNTQVYLLDNYLKPVPIGVAGELYISGDGVGNGYLNNPDLTARSFIDNPFIPNTKMYKTGDLCKFLDNGDLYYLERVDNQVKIRGLRIELGEIENKILEFPFINKVKVVKQTISNREIISAYYISSKRIRISDLRKHLHNVLPSYMIPLYFTALDDFPYTPNGKIDKKALPLPSGILKTNETTYVPPKSDLEKKLVSIWEKILNLKPIGIEDNFFELGGDSILAMNLNIQLLKITDNIEYSDIFSYPTINTLAQKINNISENKNTDSQLCISNSYDSILLENNNLNKELNYKDIGNILLTGCTGYLGIHILDAYLKSNNGKAFCIIRKEPGISPETKLLNKLHYYFGNKYDEEIGSRIFVLEGDITKQDFGMTQDIILELSNSIDTIVNSAAKVSHYGSYQEFYTVNVKSVDNLLNFANSFNKTIYHISTLSISGNSFVDQYYTEQNFDTRTEFNENNLYIGQSLQNVYVRSKFEAEKLVLDYILKGTNAYILRMGNLMPRYTDGKFQENVSENAYLSRLHAFIKLQHIPDYLLNGYLEFTPIDYSANAILKIMEHPTKNNRVFHLFNNNHLSIKSLLEMFDKLDLNISVMNGDEFNKFIKFLLKDKSSSILNNLINDFDKNLNLNYDSDIMIKCDFTIKYLKLLNFEWPLIDFNYLNKFINLLKGENFND